MLRKYQYRRLYDYTKNSGIHIWQKQNSKEYIGAEAFRYGYTKTSGTCIDIWQEQHSKEYTGTEDYTTTIKLAVLIFHNDFFDNNDEFLLSKPLRGT